MNKLEIRQSQLKTHYAFLERFSDYLGHKQDGKKLSLKLWALEKRGNKAATDYCNGDIGSEEWGNLQTSIVEKVVEAFGCAVPGLIINGDARGYTLKIDDEFVRTYYPQEIAFYRDMGGYGILSPEIS